MFKLVLIIVWAFQIVIVYNVALIALVFVVFMFAPFSPESSLTTPIYVLFHLNAFLTAFLVVTWLSKQAKMNFK